MGNEIPILQCVMLHYRCGVCKYSS